MANKTWKLAERKVARILGGKRTGNTGKATPDVEGGWFVAEVKTRRRFPLWLREGIAQAVSHCGEHQLPLLVLHQVGERYDDGLVVLRLKDFRDWFGEL